MASYWLGAVLCAFGARGTAGLLTAVVVGSASANGCASLSSPADNGSSGLNGSDGGLSSSGSSPADGAPADASSCHPGNVETFVPGAYRSATPAGQGACDGTMIQDYYDACFGPGKDASKCAMFPGTHAKCAACILTADTAKFYGPLVSSGGFVQANVAGCIEVSDPDGSLCARAVQALSDCELAACKANCPVTDSVSLMAYDSCASLADNTGCAAYQAATSCVGVELEGGLPAACNAASFKDFYDAIVPLFCGPPQASDGGAGMSSDALSEDAASEAASASDGALWDGSADASVGDAALGGDVARPSDANADVSLVSDTSRPDVSNDDAAGQDGFGGDTAL